MKKLFVLLLLLLLIPFAAWGCAAGSDGSSVTVCETATATVCTVPTVPVVLQTQPETVPTFTEPESIATEPPISLTEEEKSILLKLGMAERGNQECTECIALVMRTVLNRVESGRFHSSIRGVVFAQDQFTPISDGSYDTAEPNDRCFEALQLVLSGWDESQGALYYEWCKGPSWHSQNLHLLFQHCDTRFYD